MYTGDMIVILRSDYEHVNMKYGYDEVPMGSVICCEYNQYSHV